MRKLLVLALLLACSPAWAGDFTSPGSKAKVNGRLTVGAGGTGGPPTGDDQLLVSASKFLATWKTVPDCGGAGDTLNYTAATNTFSCGSDAGAGGGLSNIVDDTTPQLGGFLDWNGQTMSDATLTDTLVLDLDENTLSLVNDAAGATGVVIKVQHDSATPAANDLPLDLQVFAGADDEEVGRIAYQLDDGSTTTEDGRFRIFTDTAGVSQQVAAIGDGMVVGPDTALPGEGAISLFKTDDGGTGPTSSMTLNTASPAAGDVIGEYRWISKDDAGNGLTYAVIGGFIDDPTDTSEDGRLYFQTNVAGGAVTSRMRIANGVTIGSGNTTFPGDGSLRVDTIELGANTDTTLARSGAGVVTIEGATVATGGSSPTFNDMTTTDDVISGDDITAPGNLTIDTSDGRIMIGDATMAGQGAATDFAIQFGESGQPRSGLITEVDGELISLAINLAQLGGRDDAKVGGIFRFDTRSGEKKFSILYADVGAGTGALGDVAMEIALTTGVTTFQKATTVATGNLTATAGNIVASAGSVTAGNDLSATDDVIVGDDITMIEGAEINWDGGDCILAQTGNSLDTTGCTVSFASLAGVQALDADLTSWAGVTRAAGFDTFTATPSMANLGSLLSDDAAGWTTFGTTPSSANLRSLLSDEIGTGVAVFEAAAPTFDDVTTTDDVIVGDDIVLSSSDGQILLPSDGFLKFNDDSSPLTSPSAELILSRVADGKLVIGGLTEEAGIRLLEDPTSGTEYVTFIAPDSLGANRTCQLVDAAAPIPDSCVGDGTDGGGGGLSDGDYGDITVGGTGTTLNIDGDVNIGSATPTPTIEGSDTGALGPVLTLYANSATPAISDVFGRIKFQGKDSAGNITEYARIDGSAINVTDTTEVGGLVFYANVLGTPTAMAQVGGGGMLPSATDANSLGLTSFQWSDLFLAEGGVINWDNNDASITQTGNDITIAGITTLTLGTDDTVDIGTASIGVNDLFLGPTGTIEFNGDTGTTLADNGAGELTVEGKAVKRAGKQMMWIPAGSMKNDITSPASCGDTLDTGSNDLTISVCAFDTGATEERADFQIGMPKAWNESTVTFSTLLVCSSCSAAQTVQFELACVAISHDDVLNAAVGTAQASSVTVTAAGDLQAGAESSAITIAGTPAENDYVACRISRDTSVDNGAGDALLLGIKFFWTDNASTLAE